MTTKRKREVHCRTCGAWPATPERPNEASGSRRWWYHCRNASSYSCAPFLAPMPADLLLARSHHVTPCSTCAEADPTSSQRCSTCLLAPATRVQDTHLAMQAAQRRRNTGKLCVGACGTPVQVWVALPSRDHATGKREWMGWCRQCYPRLNIHGRKPGPLMHVV